MTTLFAIVHTCTRVNLLRQATEENFPHVSEYEKPEYVKSMCGVLETPEDEEELPAIQTKARTMNIPENFDSREHWPNCPSIGDIRNQGKCGSCYVSC